MLRERKVVYESRPKLIALLLINWGFVVLSLWSKQWFGLAFFGLCAAVTTYPLLDPRKKLLFYGTPAYRMHRAREFVAWQTDPGDFTYFDGGFSTPSATGYQRVAWDELRAVFAYKRDLYTTDELCLDVFCPEDSLLTITEETAGWHTFVEQLEAQLPLLPGWFGEVAAPAFETKLTLLYERENRSFAQAMTTYYPADAQPDY
jgi:hypothetical protein